MKMTTKIKIICIAIPVFLAIILTHRVLKLILLMVFAIFLSPLVGINYYFDTKIKGINEKSLPILKLESFFYGLGYLVFLTLTGINMYCNELRIKNPIPYVILPISIAIIFIFGLSTYIIRVRKYGK